MPKKQIKPTRPYLRMTGCTGTPAMKAPFLKFSRYRPLVVVPCAPQYQGFGLSCDPFSDGSLLQS